MKTRHSNLPNEVAAAVGVLVAPPPDVPAARFGAAGDLRQAEEILATIRLPLTCTVVRSARLF